MAPNPALKLNQAGLPEKQAWISYEPFIVRRLVQKGMKPTSAVLAVADKTPTAYGALQEVVLERPILVNRDPTLHRFGIMALWPVLTKGNTLQVNPSIAPPYGLDFDGDAGNYHVPVSQEAVSDAVNKMMPEQNLLSPRDSQAHYTPLHEYAQGLYLATQPPKGQPEKTFRTRADAKAAYLRNEIGADTVIKVLER